MTLGALLPAAAALSLERACYVWAWRAPDHFRRWCNRWPILPREPVRALRVLFVAFKAIQLGVFYGTRFGHAVHWHSGFPFSLLSHPQYVGTVLSVWAYFLIMRYPHPDWYALPLLETVYYTLGARLEQ